MSIKWTDLYNSEKELIEDMFKAKSDPKTTYHYQLVRGYEYVESFKRYYTKNKCLTDKQMTQLKRLASEIYKNVHNKNI